MEKIDNESARSYVASLPNYPRKDFHSFFVGANPNAVELIGQLLDMDPDRRPSAAEALTHPYLAKYHDPEDEVCTGPLTSLLLHTLYIIIYTHSLQPVCDRQYDDSFENMDLDVDGWRSKSNTLKTPFFIIFFSPHIHTHTPSLSLCRAGV